MQPKVSVSSMINLLRKVRRRLVGDGSLRKYLLYATGEFILIVGGVLVALSLNNWNNERQDRREELEILGQLRGEMRTILRATSRFRSGIERKADALARIANQLNGQETIEDPKDFLESVTTAASFGWEQPRVQRTAFIEIVGSGKLGLIRNARLRQRISRFYHGIEQREERSLNRVTEFPLIVQKLIPMQGEAILLEGLDEGELPAIAESIVDSRLHRFVVSEQNRTRFMLSIIDFNEEEAVELIQSIEEIAPTPPGIQEAAARTRVEQR